jgi:hypothetical protein
VNGQDIGLKGEISPEVFLIPNIKEVVFEFEDSDKNKRGKLEGPIPDTIGQAEKFQVIDLQNQKVSGDIPDSFYDLSTLREVDLDGTALTGTISEKVILLTSLIFWSANNMDKFDTQNLQKNFGELPRLKVFSMANSKLIGSLPSSVSKLEKMTQFDVSDNQLSGNIDFVEGFDIISSLDLGNNQFSGSIPDQLWINENLNGLFLQGNQLTGGFTEAIISSMVLPSLVSKSSSVLTRTTRFNFFSLPSSTNTSSFSIISCDSFESQQQQVQWNNPSITCG